jgi:hypothetical protein
MNLLISRLNPNIPDPVESRRRAAGKFVRIAYAAIVFGVLGFFVIYFAAPFVYLGGPGTVSSPRYVVSLPYTVQVSHMNMAPGGTVKVGEEIGQVLSPEQDSIVGRGWRSFGESGGTMNETLRASVAPIVPERSTRCDSRADEEEP